MTSWSKPCKNCNDPKPIVTYEKKDDGSWEFPKNADGSIHRHNTSTGHPRATQHEQMTKFYPDTAPRAPPARDAYKDEIRQAHAENIQSTKDQIAAIDRQTSAINRLADLVQVLVEKYTQRPNILDFGRPVQYAQNDSEMPRLGDHNDDDDDDDEDSFKRERKEDI